MKLSKKENSHLLYTEEPDKVCNKCKHSLPYDEFPYSKINTCRSCIYLYRSIWKEENKVAYNLHQKADRAKKPYRRYAELVGNSKRRGKELKITCEEYVNMNLDTCYYCDADITSESGHRLNRIDNSKGYSVDNVRPCCKICNTIMHNYEIEQLAPRLSKILNRMRLTKR